MAETTEVLPGGHVTFALLNHGPGRILYGHPYRVERYDGGKWVEAHVHDSVAAFDLIASAMPAGGAFSQKLELRADVALGRYRVVKDATVNGDNVRSSFEFVVVASKLAD